MKIWNFIVKRNPQEIYKRLTSTLESVGGFIFNIDKDSNDSFKFEMRKPVKYPDQILHHNRIVVNGKLLKTGTENEAAVEITFTQHLLMTLTVLSIVFTCICLIVVISKTSSITYMVVLGTLLLAVGIVLWIAMQKKFERDMSKYKTLLSRLLES